MLAEYVRLPLPLAGRTAGTDGAAMVSVASAVSAGAVRGRERRVMDAELIGVDGRLRVEGAPAASSASAMDALDERRDDALE